MSQPSGGAGFQGINPAETGTLISTITSNVSRAQAIAEGYIPQFSRLGLSTGPINTLLSDYSWATGAQGTVMLQRRQSLAEHQPSGDFLKGGWTTTGAGTLTYPTNAAAAQAGKLKGEELHGELNDGDAGAVVQEMQFLKDNHSDVAYMAALFTALGPDGLSKISKLATGSSANAKLISQTVGESLAVASYGMSHAQAVAFLGALAPLPSLHGVPKGLPVLNAPNLDALMPFLTQGKFSGQFLSALAPYAVNSAFLTAADPQPPADYDEIFQAIANNPQAAAQIFQQNKNLLDQYMTEDNLFTGGNGPALLTNNKAFGQFLVAATVAPKGDTSPQFKENAADFVRMFGSKPVSTSATVNQVMAVDAVMYFSDLKNTVTAAAPGAGSTMGLTAAQWGMFVQNAMKDPSAAAYLIGNYANWRNAQPADNVKQNGAGDNSTTATQAGYWHNSTLGMLDYFFASNYQAAGTTAGSTRQSLFVALDTAASVIGPLVTTALTLGPEASIPAFFLEVASGDATIAGTGIAGSNATSAALTLTVNYAVKYGLIAAGTPLTTKLATIPGATPGALGDTLVSVQSNWAQVVGQTWAQSGSKPGHPNFLAGYGVQKNSKGISYIQYNGHSYTGDPLPYEQKYNGYFMNGDGTIKSFTEIQKNPAQLAAYNAWLQDPAVSFQNGQSFMAQGDGSAFEYVQQALSGAKSGGGSNDNSGAVG